MRLDLLRHVSWPELRHHPWRHAVAWLAVVLGVALAFSVHLINQSALAEFSNAVRQANGQPDFELRAQREGFDEAVYARVANHPSVASASPLLDLDARAVDASGNAFVLRVVGLDALVAAGLTPALLPRPDAGADRFALLDPDSVFLNRAARERLGNATKLPLQIGERRVEWAIAGSVAADGPPLAVMDIAGAQAAFDTSGASPASTCGSPPAPTAPPCCASSRCRPACAPPRRTNRRRASRTCRAPTA